MVLVVVGHHLVYSVAEYYWWAGVGAGVVSHCHFNTIVRQGDICQYIIYMNNILPHFIYTYRCTGHSTIHHDNRHLLTTDYNSITSPDVSSPLDPHHCTQSALYWIKKPYWVAEFEQIIFLVIFEVYFHSIPALSPLLLSPSIFCCYWDTSPMDYTFAMKHNIVSGSNQINRKSLSLSFYFSIWAILTIYNTINI